MGLGSSTTGKLGLAWVGALDLGLGVGLDGGDEEGVGGVSGYI